MGAEHTIVILLSIHVAIVDVDVIVVTSVVCHWRDDGDVWANLIVCCCIVMKDRFELFVIWLDDVWANLIWSGENWEEDSVSTPNQPDQVTRGALPLFEEQSDSIRGKMSTWFSFQFDIYFFLPQMSLVYFTGVQFVLRILFSVLR